jgi:STE24 endopeptidase
VNEDKASRFHRRKRWAQVGAAAAGASLLVAWMASGASALVRDLARALAHAVVTSEPNVAIVEVAAYVIILSLSLSVVELPFEFYRSFLLERRYGLTTETLRTWLGDHAKALLIGAVVGLVAAEVAYAALRWSAGWWWLVTGLAFAAGLAALAVAAPVLLLPLFYRFVPLDRQGLADRLLRLSRRTGVPVVGVYEWRLGEKSRRANAALVGIGPTRRILLSDTLLSGYSEDEVEVILAHELSHHVHHDLRRMVMLDGLVMIAALGVGHVALVTLGTRVGLAAPHDVAGLPLLVLAGGLTGLAATPLLNALSRRDERRADRCALDLTRNVPAFVSAMRRLGAQNLAEEQPSRMVEWWFYGHPPLAQRLDAAREWAQRDGDASSLSLADPGASGSSG